MLQRYVHSSTPIGLYENTLGRVYWSLLRSVAVPPPYLRLIDRIHRSVRPRAYLEIGVALGRSITLALPGTRAVGVDPRPEVRFALSDNTTVFPMTSDDFFASQDLGEVLSGLPLDLAFIDGMHHFEYALRDFINIETHSTPDSTVLIHDCYPIDEKTADRERFGKIWSGDVWRLVACLKAYRPDLSVSVVDVPPTGLGIVRQLDPSSRVLGEAIREIEERYLQLPFSYLVEEGKDKALNRIPDDWSVIRPLLPAAPFRTGSIGPETITRACGAVPAAARAVRQKARRTVEGLAFSSRSD